MKVYKYKYIAVTVSGALAGLAGAYLAIVGTNVYREGQTAGRGYIGLATMIFGNWKPMEQQVVLQYLVTSMRCNFAIKKMSPVWQSLLQSC